MSASVVICAYTLDRWDDLVAAVQSCVDQTLRPHEIVVVIDHNEVLRKRAALSLTSAHVVANQLTKGLSGARNTGVVVSTGDVVAFLDDDAYADREWLERLIAPMNDQEVVGVGGWILPHWQGDVATWFPESFYWVFGCSYEGLPTNGSVIRNPIGANMAMRRKLFETVGGFTSGIGRVGQVPLGCEETELCIRYTTRCPNERFVMARDAIVHHRVPHSRLSWKYFWTRCWAEGISKAAVTSLAGTNAGLSSERRYVMRTLPTEFLGSVRRFRAQPRSNGLRIFYMLVGTTCAVAGLIVGRIALRRRPITSNTSDLDLLMTTPTSGDG